MPAIKLHSGHVIRLSSLRQSHTYEGCLLGIPRKQKNDERVEMYRKLAAGEFHMPPVVIEPEREPFDVFPDHPGSTEMLGPREYLPNIVCSARFSSTRVKQERADCSLLVFLWFQKDWALPIDPGVVEKIRAVDWEALAANWTD